MAELRRVVEGGTGARLPKAAERSGQVSAQGWAGTHRAVLYNALFRNTAGFLNTAMGSEALENNTTGSSNTAMGGFALFRNTTGQLNVDVGQALPLCV